MNKTVSSVISGAILASSFFYFGTIYQTKKIVDADFDCTQEMFDSTLAGTFLNGRVFKHEEFDIIPLVVRGSVYGCINNKLNWEK